MSVVPGPRPLPIIGSLHKLKKPPILVFSELAKIYGEVFLIKLGSTNHVILNSVASLRQAFDDQWKAFSYRPDAFTGFNLYKEVRGETNVGITCCSASTDVWKLQHQLIRLSINHFVFDEEQNRFEKSIQTEASKIVTSWLGKEPSCVIDPINSLESVICALNAACILGDRVIEAIENVDQRLTEYNRASVDMLKLMKGEFITDFLPRLGFLEKSKHDHMREILSIGERFFEDIYKTHQRCYQEGSKDSIMDCVATFHTELEDNAPGGHSISKKTVMGVISDLLEGVVNASSVFFQVMLYMIYFPDVQDKVRDELNEVVGTSRNPTMADRKKLPFTEAVIYEVCRHSSTVSFTPPHAAAEDVVLGGRYNMLIPKGAFVIGNLSAIQKDPKEFTNPSDFNPERFIKEDGNLNDEKIQKCMIFSVGKRSCVAEMMVRREIFLLYSTLLHLCRFENKGGPLEMQELRGVAIPRDGSMKVMIRRTDAGTI